MLASRYEAPRVLRARETER